MNLEQLKAQLLSALGILNRLQVVHKYTMPRKELLYQTAKKYLGIDASPNDLAPDEVGCAETVSDIIRHAFPELRFPVLLSTRDLFAHLLNSPSFGQVSTPEYGDIIISVTGTGNGRVKNGHTGILGKYGVLSNDSRSGLFLENYTVESWKLYYEGRGGFYTHFFRAL